MATIVTPGTILRWYRRLIAQKWTSEYRDHLILFGERRLLHVLKEFVVHYHEERNHQGSTTT